MTDGNDDWHVGISSLHGNDKLEDKKEQTEFLRKNTGSWKNGDYPLMLENAVIF